MGWFADEGLVTDCAPVVAAQENAGNPHYMPTADAQPRRSGRTRSCCSISGASCRRPARCLLTSRGWGLQVRRCRTDTCKAFNAARDGRDAAIALVQERRRAGREVRGFEVDRACRDVIEQAGFGAQFIHRTGHSLGTEVHGNGVHMDDYETHDERRLIPGTGFTIEPGVYTAEFGVRTEINMFVGEREATVTGPLQRNSFCCRAVTACSMS